jgi:glutamate-ammonia-ligase adenylyltransferase
MVIGRATSLSDIVRLGFESLTVARDNLVELENVLGSSYQRCVSAFETSASPDKALTHLLELARNYPKLVNKALAGSSGPKRLVAILGASDGLAEYLTRHPSELSLFSKTQSLPSSFSLNSNSRIDLRVSYRRVLLAIADWDLGQADPADGVVLVTNALSRLADAALETGLAVARSELISDGRISQEKSDNTQLSIIAMGKTGADELNYVSDVDVIYVADGPEEYAIATATQLAQRLGLVINEAAVEPGLWEVDPNLRPEGKNGALVRTVAAHAAHYTKWAEPWEFQALLKARFAAGAKELGNQYLSEVKPQIWGNRERSNLVQHARQMRKRVIDQIPMAEKDLNIKLGRGGLRDVEFTVQLLQLVHGVVDESLRESGTFPAIQALADAGLLGRDDALALQRQYRLLRVIEHRLQLVKLRRTHLVPTDASDLRRIARGLNPRLSADDLKEIWLNSRQEIASLHDTIFFRPLLAATAALSPGEISLTASETESRLVSLGFTDPKGAMRHLQALSQGMSRGATIQRSLLPVLLRWMAEGMNPDGALLSFRRLSELLGDKHWFLKMLRDSSGAAERLMEALSNSVYISRLLEYTPESTAWFADESKLQPTDMISLETEVGSFLARNQGYEKAAEGLKFIRRREVLRIAIGSTLGNLNVRQVAMALSEVTEIYLGSMLIIAGRKSDIDLDVSIVAMGRLGGQELGFGSDADVMLVYKDDDPKAQSMAETLTGDFIALVKDSILEFELDLDLRPEGKNGPRIKSLSAYEGYYEKWAETWEFQALLRARPMFGSQGLRDAFTDLIDKYRYPEELSNKQLVSIRLVKARVENERLPKGIDAYRHLKLGPGAISDVEWLVQLMQLRYAGTNPELRSLTTLDTLASLVKLGHVDATDSQVLEDAWIMASRVRSAQVLALDKSSDELPIDRHKLEAIARVLEFEPGSATDLEERYLSVTRRSRAVFQKLFLE